MLRPCRGRRLGRPRGGAAPSARVCCCPAESARQGGLGGGPRPGRRNACDTWLPEPPGSLGGKRWSDHTQTGADAAQSPRHRREHLRGAEHPPCRAVCPPLPRTCSLNPEGTDFLLPKGPPSGSQVARLWPPSTRSSEVTPGPLAQARPQWAERRGGGWRAPRSVQTPGDAPGRAEVGPHPCEAAGGTLWRPVRGRNPPAPSAMAGTAARAAATASCPCPVPPRILRSSQLPRTWATDSTTPSGGGKRGPREEEPEPSAAPSPPGHFLRNTRSHAPRLPRGRPVRGRVPAPSCAPTTPRARPGGPATACSSQAH